MRNLLKIFLLGTILACSANLFVVGEGAFAETPMDPIYVEQGLRPFEPGGELAKYGANNAAAPAAPAPSTTGAGSVLADSANPDVIAKNLAEGVDPAAADITNGAGGANAPAANATAPATTTAGSSTMDKAWAAIKQFFTPKSISYNYGQHALLIAEALKENDIKDATKKVKVKGADAMQGSQGSMNPTYATQKVPDTPMSGTTLTDSVNAMVDLLKTNTIDISLLSTDPLEKTQTEAPEKGGVTLASSRSQADLDPTTRTSGQKSEEEEEGITTEHEREIRNRRALLVAEWATAAAQIGEGSNAISSKFYERAQAFVDAANGANGSLGGISTINDTDRFVLFELTRGAALSTMELGLQAAVTLNEADVSVPKTETSSGT